jgi:hypothetical protein
MGGLLMYPYLSEALEQVEPRPAAYVLLGADGAYLYKGACRNLQQRLRDHRAGRASHTKNRRPLRLFFVHAGTRRDRLDTSLLVGKTFMFDTE